MPLKRPFIRFLLLIAVSYGSWFLLYEFILKPDGRIDHIITEYVTIGVCRLLQWTGYDVYYTIGQKFGETYIFMHQQLYPVVRVGASCNGLELLVLFSLFIICYPGNWLYKLAFGITGNFIIHIVNIFRTYCLTLLSIHHSPHYDFYHRYVFIFMVYGVIFLLWMLWANYFSHLKLKYE